MTIRETAPTLMGMILTILLVTICASAAWAGVPEKVLVSFNGTSVKDPTGLSMDAAGNLWGVSNSGGNGSCQDGETATGCGAVFELTATSGGWVTKMIYAFQGGRDGQIPTGNLAFDGQGNVYGVTYLGGIAACQCGTVYKLTPQSGHYKETVIYRFGSNSFHDGENPVGGLVIDPVGNLYGTTEAGGEGNGGGVVFELTPPSGGGWTESVLYSFGEANRSAHGAVSYSPLVLDRQRNLYGTTYYGGMSVCSGGPGGCGVVFELSPIAGGGWTESILHNFQGDFDGYSDGSFSYSGLILDAAGNLYGTTSQGGDAACISFPATGCGTVFELSPTAGGAWTESIIHAFSSHDGQNPLTGLTFDAAGNLYGVTGFGGVFNLGTAFELTRGAGASWSESILHNFGNGKDGQRPSTALVFDSAGTIYGATPVGGSDVTGFCDGNPSGCGTVFRLTP